jgi:hypothetical protein
MLEHGHEPVAVGRRPYGADIPFRRPRWTMWTARAGVRGLGGIHPPRSRVRTAGFHEVLEVNVAGTARALDAAVEAGAAKSVPLRRVQPPVSRSPPGTACPTTFRSTRAPCAPDDSYGLEVARRGACACWSRAHGLATLSLRINHNWYVDRDGVEAALRAGGWARACRSSSSGSATGCRSMTLTASGPPTSRPFPVTCSTPSRTATRREPPPALTPDRRHEVLMINGFQTGLLSRASASCRAVRGRPRSRDPSGRDAGSLRAATPDPLRALHTWRERLRPGSALRDVPRRACLPCACLRLPKWRTGSAPCAQPPTTIVFSLRLTMARESCNVTPP